MLTFSKKERLCSQKLIDALFHKGHRFMVFPYSVVWHLVEGEQEVPCQVMITAPKRKLRHAVDRNSAKRHTRELYRHAKPVLYEALGQRRLLLSISYVHTSVLPHDKLSAKFDKMLATLIGNLA